MPPPAAAPEPIVVSSPERIFAGRMPASEPPRPLPTTRRGIFFDVENSSRPEHVAAVLDHLKIDRLSRLTDLVAMGNWKVASGDTARLLAQRGAQLVHSAPSTGVKDYSDLRIAVSAGVWLAAARPGDLIEIITDDQAFDAVGDVAAGLGVTFHRLSFRALAGMGVLPPAPQLPEEMRSGGRGRGRGRGRRGRGGRPDQRPAVSHVPSHRPPSVHPAPAHHAPAAAAGGGPAHTAPAEEIRAVVDELLLTSPIGVTLDALSNALKSRGFRRPPGSPRLITRLRNLKGIEVTRNGIVRLLESGGGGARPQPAAEEPAPSRQVSQLAGMPEIVASNFDSFGSVEDRETDTIETEEGPEPGNEAVPPPRQEGEQAGRGRRRRRGGRRRRGRRGGGGPGGGSPSPADAAQSSPVARGESAIASD
ncbi:MAG TPA: hypothetical protein VFX14_23115 [Methylomirabilota bacterium]|nr:hypothetical protein [Methylomirabilota bacterium]